MISAPDPRFASANQLFQRGMLREAEAQVRQILSSNPRDAEALHLLGMIAIRSSQPATAIDLITTAIEIKPGVAQFFVNRAEAFRATEQRDRAMSDYRHAIELDPNNAIAHYNLGLALTVAQQPDGAIESYRTAIRLRPDYTKAHYNLANTLLGQGRFDEAEVAYNRTVALDPSNVEAWNNLGKLHFGQMNVEEADKALRRSLALRPEHAKARFNLAMLELLRGDYRAGWQNYECRYLTPAQEKYAPRFPQPKWDGSDLAGKTILLFGEQGAGDMIQFVRYAPLIAQRGAERIIVSCENRVASLMKTVPGVDEVVRLNDPPPPFDVYLPVLSAPCVFDTTLETVPNHVPYVFADPAKVEAWRAKLAPHRAKLNVGLTWAGNPKQQNDSNRSAKLSQLAPLANMPDTTFFSLQKGQAIAQIADSPIKLVDLTNDLNDFMDTAAAIMNLDVVVSVCTSVAHLAGALGQRTLTMLCYNADWRWLMHRSDSPWYPTMKLFRQDKQGNWMSVAQRIRDELSAL